MNKNRRLTPLAAVLMLSGGLMLAGCDGGNNQQGDAQQQMPEVGIVTLKTEALNVMTELRAVQVLTALLKFAHRLVGLFSNATSLKGRTLKQVHRCIKSIRRPIRQATTAPKVHSLRLRLRQKLPV